MRFLLKKLLASTLGFTMTASLIVVVPIILTATPALPAPPPPAATLDNATFSRTKVTSAFKNTGGTAYATCYGSGGLCTVQRSSSYEWSLPSGGYFQLERSVNPSFPWRVKACTSGGDCSIASTIGKIYAYKPDAYFIYRAPNASYNWVFSLGNANPYSVALNANISWGFDGPGTGREGEYIAAPSSVTSSIEGELTAGSTLTAEYTYVGVDGQVTFQWKRSTQIKEDTFTDIPDADLETYILTNDDAGKYIRLTVAVTNFFGTRSTTSNFVLIEEPPAQLDSTFGTVTSTLGGFTVNVTNYDATYTYEASTTGGNVSIGTADGKNLPLTITGLTSSQNVQVTVKTSKAGIADGEGTVSGTSLASAITTSTGPVGRWISSSIAHESGRMFVANQGGYLYTSTDNGVNWQQRASIRNWSSVAQSDNGATIFATVAGGKIQKSINSGATWSEVASVKNWRTIACDSDCSVVLAGVSGGKLWRSLDFGATWRETESTRNWRSVSLSANGEKMLALPYNAAPYFSTNSGATWSAGPTNLGSLKWSSGLVDRTGNEFIAAPLTGSIVFSDDSGATWASFNVMNSTTSISLANGLGEAMQCGNDGHIAVVSPFGGTGLARVNGTPWSSCSISANGEVLLATSTTGLIYTSNNAGVNWSARSISSGNVNRRALVTSENGDQIYSAVYGGKIEYSEDSGATWRVSADLTQNWIGIAASNSFQKIYAVGYQGALYRSVDSGVTWERSSLPSLTWVSIATSTDGSKIVAVAKGGNIYTSANSGDTWSSRETKRKWVSVASSSNGDKLAAVVEGGFIYTSENSGSTWTQRGTSQNWSAIASSSNGNKLVATVAQGRIYTSTNAGESWTARDSSRNWLNVVSSTSGNKLIAVVGTGKIYTSRNSGKTWTSRESDRNWRALIITGNGNRAYAADFGKKLYRSADSGETWTVL